MAKNQRDYSNLRETERVWDAVKLHGTEIKDYSLTYIVRTGWRLDDEQERYRIVHVDIGPSKWAGYAPELWNAINNLVDEADENGWLPRKLCYVDGIRSPMVIDTVTVNDECLRDHVARVTVGEATAILDLEELLKGTRYA